MMWKYWLTLYIETHCTARGLSSNTIAAYKQSLEGFQGFVQARLENKSPDKITAMDILKYVEFLRSVRNNGDTAVNRQVTVIKNLYRAMVSMGQLAFDANPTVLFPKIKAGPRKLPTWLSKEEITRLMRCPRKDTVMGLRDRALVVILYGTGIRAGECSRLQEEDVDLANRTISVIGKGGHQRVIPLSQDVLDALSRYRQVRGLQSPKTGFFQSRKANRMSRTAIYERIRTIGRRAGIEKLLSPHRLRHTFATHLVKEGVPILTISKLLGHRQLTSTQVYLHVTAEDLREAADMHPVGRLIEKLENFLPNMRLPFQYPLAERRKEVQQK